MHPLKHLITVTFLLLVTCLQAQDSVFCCKRHEREYLRRHPAAEQPKVSSEVVNPVEATGAALETSIMEASPDSTTAIAADSSTFSVIAPPRPVKTGLVKRVLIQKALKKLDKTELFTKPATSKKAGEYKDSEAKIAFWLTTAALIISLGALLGGLGIFLFFGMLLHIPALIFGIRTLKFAPEKWQGYYSTIISGLGIALPVIFFLIIFIFLIAFGSGLVE